MNHFCTLFDSGFLSRGLVLYQSLVTTGIDFRLAVFAFDDVAVRVLHDLALDRITVVTLGQLEDPGLLAVKSSRSRAEYCWTSTSSTVLYCLETLGWPEVTYLDADLYFFSSPEVLLAEMGSASVLLTAHNYAPAYDQSRLSGTYCVQFMRFVADERGLGAAHWWRDRCLEWCYDRREDGKFGDQFYLEDWTTRFEGVHALEHQGGGLAPWNISQYRLVGDASDWRVTLDQREWVPVFYHFHGVRFFEGGIVGLDNYRLGSLVINRVYLPYLQKLVVINDDLARRYPEHDWVRARPLPRGPRAWLGRLKNTLLGTWNFLPRKQIFPQGAPRGQND